MADNRRLTAKMTGPAGDVRSEDQSSRHQDGTRHMKRIAVVGTGYVGLTTGACFAELGNGVVCMDIDAAKIEMLRGGEVPFFEPGLGEMVARNVAAQRLSFTTDYAAAIPQAEVVFIAVATPTTAAGRADLRYVRTAAQPLGAPLCGHTILAKQSTVPTRTGG